MFQISKTSPVILAKYDKCIYTLLAKRLQYNNYVTIVFLFFVPQNQMHYRIWYTVQFRDFVMLELCTADFLKHQNQRLQTLKKYIIIISGPITREGRNLDLDFRFLKGKYHG